MIKEWFDHPCLRIANVQRYSTVPTIHKESVAEHTFFVTFLAWQLALATKADAQLVFEIAVSHDLDEAFSGDMPRPFKYSDNKLRERLEDASQGVMYAALGHDSPVLEAWEEGKTQTLEAQCVKFADLWSCLLFAYRERLLGSSSFADQVLDRAPENFQSIVWHPQLKPYVDELLEFAGRNYS